MNTLSDDLRVGAKAADSCGRGDGPGKEHQAMATEMRNGRIAMLRLYHAMEAESLWWDGWEQVVAMVILGVRQWPDYEPKTKAPGY